MNEQQIQSELVAPWWASPNAAEFEQVMLYRVEGSSEELLERVTVTRETVPTFEDFKLFVKEGFGGGLYVAVVRGPQGQYQKRERFAIAGLPKREQQAPKTQEPEQGQLMALVLAQMQKSDERFAAVIEKMSQPKEDGMQQALGLLVQAKEIFGSTGVVPQAKTLAEQFAELKSVKDFLGELGGDEEGGSANPDILGLLAGGIGPIIDLMKDKSAVEKLKVAAAVKMQQQRNQRPAAPAQPTAPAISQDAEAVQLPPGFDALIGQACTMAAAGMPAESIAALVVQHAPDPLWLKEFLERDDALSQLEKVAPEVGTHWEWFAELANTLLELLGGGVVIDANASAAAGEAEPPAKSGVRAKPKADNSGRRGGNVANAADHARPRTPRKPAAGNTKSGLKPNP